MARAKDLLKLEFQNTKEKSVFWTPLQRLPNMVINIIMTWIAENHHVNIPDN